MHRNLLREVCARFFEAHCTKHAPDSFEAHCARYALDLLKLIAPGMRWRPAPGMRHSAFV